MWNQKDDEGVCAATKYTVAEVCRRGHNHALRMCIDEIVPVNCCGDVSDDPPMVLDNSPADSPAIAAGCIPGNVKE